MSRVALQPYEDVRTTPRRAMTKARKRRIFKAADGLCAWCQKPIAWPGEPTVFDHRTPLALGGSDEDDNIRPLHAKPCDAAKTHFDQKMIAKAKRIQAKIRGDRAKRKAISSRGFDTSLTRKFNGQTVRRRET